MLYLAASGSEPATFTVIREIPVAFWLRLALGIAITIGTVLVARRLSKANPVVLGVVVFVAATIVGFSWIYDRDEPAWATPVVQWLARFFPTKDAY